MTIGLQNCGDRIVSVDELRAYSLNESNGLLQRVDNGNSVVEVIYHPKDLVFIQEISGRSLSKEQFDSIRNGIQVYDYFLLKLSKNGQEIVNSYTNDRIAYNKAINYLSYGISADIVLVNNNESIDVEDFSYSQTFGSSSSSTLLVVFKSSLQDRLGRVLFIFNDNFFNTGVSEFQFKTEDIRAIPIVDFNQMEL